MSIKLKTKYTLEVFKFPGGEVSVKVTPTLSTFGRRLSKLTPAIVEAEIRNSDDIMTLLLTVDALRREGEERVLLNLPYVPYARQDRVCNRGESLSIKVFADLINSMDFESVYISDPHSDVAPALINNCTIIKLKECIDPQLLDKYLLVCPDAGAEKKILTLGKPYVMATKVRNVLNGEIVATKIYDTYQVVGKNCLIVDDICDGGRTFIELAKELHKAGAVTVSLYVTHGIFSKGKEELYKYIDNIYCPYDWTND